MGKTRKITLGILFLLITGGMAPLLANPEVSELSGNGGDPISESDNLDDMFLNNPEDDFSDSSGFLDIFLEGNLVGMDPGMANELAGGTNSSRGSTEKRTGLVQSEAILHFRGEYKNSLIRSKLDGEIQYSPPGTGFSSPSDSPLLIREGWVGTGETYQFHGGVIRRNWGSADLFRAVNYTDALDFRQFILTDRDRLYVGSPSADFRWIGKSSSLELVWIPIHSHDLSPPEDSFWDVPYASQQLWVMDSDKILTSEWATWRGNLVPAQWIVPVSLQRNECYILQSYLKQTRNTASAPSLACEVEVNQQEAKELQVKPSNFAWAGRASLNELGTDWHAQFYHGPSRTAYTVLQNRTSMTGDQDDTSLEMETGYDRETKFGVDMQTTHPFGTVRGELSITMDRPGTYVDPVGQLRKKDGKQVSYVVGTDFNFNKNRGRFFVEWSDQNWMDSNFMDDTLSDLLVWGFSHTFMDGKLELSLLGLTRPVSRDPGMLAMGQAKADLNDDLSFTVGLLWIDANRDTIFKTYESRDIAFFKVEAKLY